MSTTTRLDRLTPKGSDLVDTAGRQVSLRGMVTITADHRGPFEMHGSNYDQIASFGFNCQQVRLEGARLGVLGTTRDPGYLDKLDRWVTLAAQRGIYSVFKLTTYDVPALGAWAGAFSRDNWERFWTEATWRQDRIDAWRPVWERLAGRPEILGYDFLNEPCYGHSTPRLAEEKLYPFYEDATRALREIDSEALAVLQPAVRVGVPRVELPHGEQVRFGDRRCVYSPHFYADVFQELSPEQYDEEVRGFITEAEQVGAPMLIGEYGQPDAPFLITATAPPSRSWNLRDARLGAATFDRHGISCLRIWYTDEAQWTVLGPGFTETERLTPIVRPYVQRCSGRSSSWSFDDETRAFEATLEIEPSVAAETVVVVPRERHYAQGLRIALDGLEQPALTVDDDRLLLPSGTLTAGRHTLTITPR